MAKRPADATCENCCYWNKMLTESGECRYDPPALFDDGETRWPTTNAADWCGHYNNDWDNTEPKEAASANH